MMKLLGSVDQVFEGIQGAKTGATEFCTNFFPVRAKIQAWIDHQELLGHIQEGMAFFLRKDRNFWHLFFSAGSPALLKSGLSTLAELSSERVATDLIGNEAGLEPLSKVLEGSGFRSYARLMRLARPHQPCDPGQAAPVIWAGPEDAQDIFGLLGSAFDQYADQLPTAYEIDSAIATRQILIIKDAAAVAGVLFFETQGLTSTLRYWVVADGFQSHGYGSALIRHYFFTHNTVRRFVLWVTAKNENAVQKYQHYGYAADGLLDHVLVNEMIRS
jgi:hypothetical protein